MKFNNEFGYSVKSREYFLLKAVLYYDYLCEMERDGLVLIKKTDGEGRSKTVLDLINEIAIKITLESDVSNAEFIVNELDNWPVSDAELKVLLSGPLENYLSFQV